MGTIRKSQLEVLAISNISNRGKEYLRRVCLQTKHNQENNQYEWRNSVYITQIKNQREFNGRKKGKHDKASMNCEAISNYVKIYITGNSRKRGKNEGKTQKNYFKK